MTAKAKKAASRVVLSDKFMNDKRFALLATYCAEDEHKTRIRVIELWFECFRLKTDEMTREQVDLHTRWTGTAPFAELMARSSLAERLSDGKYRVRGVKDQLPKERMPRELVPGMTLGQEVNVFISKYCEIFKQRWGTQPQLLGGRYLGAAKNIVDSVGAARACALVETYLTMNDRFFLTKKHDLVTMEFNLNSIAIKHDTGTVLSHADMRSLEQRESLLQAGSAHTDWMTD